MAYPFGVALDLDGAILVADAGNCRVMKWVIGMDAGVLVAGGEHRGAQLNQLDFPIAIAVDQGGALIIADRNNDRIVKWAPGAQVGIVIAGGEGQGAALDQFYYPDGVALDDRGAVLVADEYNHRVVRWEAGADAGVVVAGGNGHGLAVNQLNFACGVAFARSYSWRVDHHSMYPLYIRRLVRLLLVSQWHRKNLNLSYIPAVVMINVLLPLLIQSLYLSVQDLWKLGRRRKQCV